jgi:hypothetical protein
MVLSAGVRRVKEGSSSLSPCGRGRLREAKTGEGYFTADKNPSSGTDFVRATFSHKGRRKEQALYRSHNSGKFTHDNQV